MEVLKEGYGIPFQAQSPLAGDPIFFKSYSSSSGEGKARLGEISTLVEKGAVGLAAQFPGYYSCMFMDQKASGAWHPVINFSTLNKFTQMTWFHMETT